MPKKKSPFYLSAKKIWETVVDTDATEVNELKLQLEIHKRLLNIFQVGLHYYYVFNIYQGEIEFVSPGVTKVLGYEPEEMTAEFLMDKIHPDDKPYFLNFEYRIAEFFKNLPFEKISNYKAQYDIRFRAADNRYVRVLHQAVQIEYSAENFYRTLDLDTDITHIKPEGVPVFSIIGLDDEPSYYNIQATAVFSKSYDLFTRREREILKYVVEGSSSREIADKLCISLHTVHTHRKKIIGKAEVKTPVELVNKVISEGWL